MQRAVQLARRGLGATSPNPAVGAVLTRDGRELGAGWHQQAGSAHAEVAAISDVRSRHGLDGTVGTTLYVTLEPCSTRGRTGACTDAIKAAGIRRVVFGCVDPNPSHAGRAEALLGREGIEVVQGVEEEACAGLIRGFAKVQRCGLPWVIVKTAMSLDGRITRPDGEGPWLSSPESREDVQLLRAEVDAILTSGQTVRADNPRLTLRNLDAKTNRPQPWRVILTSRELGVPDTAKVMCDEHAERTRVFAGQRIESVLRELASDYGVCSLLVEAGGRLLGRFLDEEWADEIVVYLAPLVTGGPVPALGGEGATSLAERIRVAGPVFERIADDVKVRGLLAGRGGSLERGP